MNTRSSEAAVMLSNITLYVVFVLYAEIGDKLLVAPQVSRPISAVLYYR